MICIQLLGLRLCLVMNVDCVWKCVLAFRSSGVTTNIYETSIKKRIFLSSLSNIKFRSYNLSGKSNTIVKQNPTNGKHQSKPTVEEQPHSWSINAGSSENSVCFIYQSFSATSIYLCFTPLLFTIWQVSEWEDTWKFCCLLA